MFLEHSHAFGGAFGQVVRFSGFEENHGPNVGQLGAVLELLSVGRSVGLFVRLSASLSLTHKRASLY